LLRSYLLEGIGGSFRDFQEVFWGEHIYGYSLCTDPLASSVGAKTQSEEGLERHIQRIKSNWKANQGEEVELLRKAERWPGHDGWEYIEKPFENANHLLSECYGSDPDAYHEIGAARLVITTYLACLAELDFARLFGEGGQRLSIVLSLYMGDQTVEDERRWVSQVNPLDVYNRYTTESYESESALQQLVYIGPS
jgi:hypothetical protein